MYWNSKFLENAAVSGDTEDTELGLMYLPYENLQPRTPPLKWHKLYLF